MHLLNFTAKQLEHFKGIGHKSKFVIDKEKLKTVIIEFDCKNINYKKFKFFSPCLLDL